MTIERLAAYLRAQQAARSGQSSGSWPGSQRTSSISSSGPISRSRTSSTSPYTSSKSAPARLTDESEIASRQSSSA
jgi:hypothetical protein